MAVEVSDGDQVQEDIDEHEKEDRDVEIKESLVPVRCNEAGGVPNRRSWADSQHR